MINLLPYKEKKSIEKIRFLRMLNSVIIAILFLIVASLLLILPTWLTINSRFSLINNELKSLEKKGMISNEIDIGSLLSRSQKAKQKLVSGGEKSNIYLINLLKSLAPKGITIDRLSLADEKSIEIFGVFASRESLQSFTSSLSRQAEVSSVDSPVSNFVKNKNGTFRLTVFLK